MIENNLIIVFLLVLMNVLVISIVFIKDNYKVIILSSLFSVFAAALYLMLRAPDVALTEAAIGVCISSLIFLSTLQKSKSNYSSMSSRNSIIFKIIIFLVFFAYLCQIIGHLPVFGSRESLASSSEVINFYIDKSRSEIKSESLVANILASFRSFDTFGETLVIFLAMVCVLYIAGCKNEERQK